MSRSIPPTPRTILDLGNGWRAVVHHLGGGAVAAELYLRGEPVALLEPDEARALVASLRAPDPCEDARHGL